MGKDKALVRFCGRPMVEIAVEKLRTFCAAVSISGNREDLEGFAPVVREGRVDIGPAAGIEAGLRAAEQPWVLFVPVDVPLAPAELLRRWAEDALATQGLASSTLLADGVRQPAFCMFRRDSIGKVTAAIEAGRLRLNELLDAAAEAGEGLHSAYDASALGGATEAKVRRWFANVNTPEELREAEAWLPRAS